MYRVLGGAKQTSAVGTGSQGTPDSFFSVVWCLVCVPKGMGQCCHTPWCLCCTETVFHPQCVSWLKQRGSRQSCRRKALTWRLWQTSTPSECSLLASSATSMPGWVSWAPCSCSNWGAEWSVSPLALLLADSHVLLSAWLMKILLSISRPDKATDAKGEQSDRQCCSV